MFLSYAFILDILEKSANFVSEQLDSSPFSQSQVRKSSRQPTLTGNGRPELPNFAAFRVS
jgi:hypothetical protein